MPERIVLVPDLHYPLEDRAAVEAVMHFIEETKPDAVICLGDVCDFHQPSRWSKDTAAEFQGSVFEDAEYTVKQFFEPLRKAYDGPIGVIEGNHDERPRVYLAKYAPALAASKAFHLPTLLEFEKYDISMLPDFYAVAEGWTATHGHLGGIRLSQESGKTAMGAAVRFDHNVVMGHTHRLGVMYRTTGLQGSEKVLTGMEAGHLTDMTKHKYLKGATANWQQGFGLLTIDGNHVQATPVRIENKAFSVDGKTYKL